ncbi:MAG: hypothetical protein EPO11_02100 [Gammaproteobacteria bacterium]|nr:MAG: hypothetical protein EPO11_02100 [Gammaproteobacteria bacterium]
MKESLVLEKYIGEVTAEIQKLEKENDSKQDKLLEQAYRARAGMFIFQAEHNKGHVDATIAEQIKEMSNAKKSVAEGLILLSGVFSLPQPKPPQTNVVDVPPLSPKKSRRLNSNT